MVFIMAAGWRGDARPFLSTGRSTRPGHLLRFRPRLQVRGSLQRGCLVARGMREYRWLLSSTPDLGGIRESKRDWYMRCEGGD